MPFLRLLAGARLGLAVSCGVFYFPDMNAAEIIEEIQQLGPQEKAKIADFLKTISGQLTGQELADLGEALRDESDPEKSREIANRITSGFYGAF